MVGVLDSKWSSAGCGHCVVFLGKMNSSHSTPLHPGIQMGTSKPLGKCDKMLALTCNGVTSYPEGEAILVVASCHAN